MSNDPTPAGKLARKLAAIAGTIEAVEKDGKNKDQNYRYATPASVMAAIKPHLAQHGVMIVPHLVDFIETDTGMRSNGGKPFMLNRVLMHYHILDGESGEAMVVPWQGQAGTYGDDKGLAKAQTIALRTFLIQLFQIPAEDPDHDPDAGDARPAQNARYESKPAPQPRQAPRPQAPQGRSVPQASQDDVHDAETKFYEHLGDAIDAQTWPDVQKWLGTKPDKPTTVEGWRDAYRLVASTLKARQSESAPPEGIAA